MKRRREEGSDKQSTHSSLLLLHCAILPRGMLIHMLAHGGGAHAMPSRAHTTHTYKRAVRHVLFSPSPPLDPPLFHTCYYAEPSCSTGTVHRGIKSCSVPRMYSTRTQSVCVCVHTRGRTDRAPPVPPPSEVAGGPLPNGVIQRSR